MQWAVAVLVRDIHVGTQFDQNLGDGEMTVPGRSVERSAATSAFTLRRAAAGGDDEGLAERVGVPCGAGARFEGDLRDDGDKEVGDGARFPGRRLRSTCVRNRDAHDLIGGAQL